MSTLTKEWLLKTIAELEEERDAVPGAVNEDAAMALAAMKLALASLEAEKMPSRWRRLRLLGFVGTQITVYLANLLLVQSYTPSRQRRYLFLNGQTSSAWSSCRSLSGMRKLRATLSLMISALV